MKLYQKILMALGLMILLGAALFTAIYWNHIPDSVPTHFGGSGEPDSYGGKNMVLVPLIVGFIAYIASSVMTFFPSLWNVPRGWSLAPIKGMVIIVNLIIALTFAYMTVCTARGTGLSSWFSPVLMAGLFGTVGIGMFLSHKRR